MTTGTDVFDKTLQETNLWLKDLMRRLDTEDRHLAYRILSTTLHAVRDRIGQDNAVHLAAQLPMLIRGFYYEGWRPSDTPTKERHVKDFLERVRNELQRGTQIDPDKAVRAVFEVMCDKLDPGEVEKLIRIFPEDLRTLWPVVRNVGSSEKGGAPGWSQP